MLTTFTITALPESYQVKGISYGSLGISIPFFLGGFASGYCITHLPTGRWVGGFNDRRIAVACLKALAKLDWSSLPTKREIESILWQYDLEDCPPAHMVEVLEEFENDV